LGVTVRTVEVDVEEDEDEDEEDDPPEVFGGGGPSALTTPGVVAPEGSMIVTACPVATVGSLGVNGTDTARVTVVTS
jgi:hypothetical protein